MVFLFRRCSGLYLRNLRTTLWRLAVFHSRGRKPSKLPLGAGARWYPRTSRRLKLSAAKSCSTVPSRLGTTAPQTIKVVLRIYACKRRVCATPHREPHVGEARRRGDPSCLREPQDGRPHAPVQVIVPLSLDPQRLTARPDLRIETCIETWSSWARR